jgi:hypothetical protein
MYRALPCSSSVGLRRNCIYTRGFQKESAILGESLPYVYSDLSTHRYFRSCVTEIRARETADFLRLNVLNPFIMVCYPYSERVCPSADSQAKPYGDVCVTYSTGNHKLIL